MSHYHPFQKLCYICQAGGISLLLAAVGPHVLALDLKNGGMVSKWPEDVISSAENGDLARNSMNDDPPIKRRKLSPSHEGEHQDSSGSSVSVEFVSERTKGQRRKKKKILKSPSPNISHIISTANGRHVIAVTAEDKRIRVFELTTTGGLKLLSERGMPKRLCAIALTRNQRTILAGDKFGDVYALPLLPSSNPSTLSPPKPQPETLKPLQPSASELTVHTKGNRDALRQQQLHKVLVSRKQEPTFEHQLILGHVSLLTDLIVGTDPLNVSREYVLTSDRDEHIRVSRGIPQAHVINNYCLGHTQFVSKICILPDLPRFLISGGGEPSIRIFDWLHGEMVAEVSLEENLKQLVENSAFSGLPESKDKRAISCIHALHFGGSNDQEDIILIMVALEGTPGISTYRFYPSSCSLKQDRQYLLQANVLDIVLIEAEGLMLVSLDNIHSPLSMKRPVSVALQPIISVFQLKKHLDNGDGEFEWIEYDPPIQGNVSVQHGSFNDTASKLEHTLHTENVRHQIEFEEIVKPKALYSTLGEFLYGLENLRKKHQGEAERQHSEEQLLLIRKNPEIRA